VTTITCRYDIGPEEEELARRVVQNGTCLENSGSQKAISQGSMSWDIEESEKR